MEYKEKLVNIYASYINYLNDKFNSSLESNKSFKLEKLDDSLWYDILKFISKHENKFAIYGKYILEQSFNCGKLDLNYFLESYLFYFIDLLSNFQNKDDCILSWRSQRLSFFDILFTTILMGNDKIENYKYIENEIEVINIFYERYIIICLDNFLEHSLICIKQGNLDNYLYQLIKELDFFESVREEKKFKLYKSAKNLFFEIKDNTIKIKFGENIKNYKDKIEIKRTIENYIYKKEKKVEEYIMLNF